MKAFVLPLLTLLTMGALVFANSAFLTRQVDLWCAEVEQAQQAAQAERWEDTLTALERVDKRWQRHSTYFHFVIRHDEIDDAEALLAETRAFAAEQHDAEFHASAAKLVAQLRRLAEEEEFSAKNVF